MPIVRLLALAGLLAVAAAPAAAAPLTPERLEAPGFAAVTHNGRRAVFLADPARGGGVVAVVRGSSFGDGVIEVDLAADVTPGAPADARGFVGVAFRTGPAPDQYEAFYLRMTNGRADDQQRRNRTAQYVAMPEHTWQKLREATPGKYESYVDTVPGRWTRMRIEVQGAKARLYVDGAAQPVLIVDRLLSGPDAPSPVAIWTGPMTQAWFADLSIRPAR